MLATLFVAFLSLQPADSPVAVRYTRCMAHYPNMKRLCSTEYQGKRWTVNASDLIGLPASGWGGGQLYVSPSKLR